MIVTMELLELQGKLQAKAQTRTALVDAHVEMSYQLGELRKSYKRQARDIKQRISIALGDVVTTAGEIGSLQTQIAAMEEELAKQEAAEQAVVAQAEAIAAEAQAAS